MAENAEGDHDRNVRFAICSEIFQGTDWPFERTCRFVRDAGYDAIEVAPFQFTPLVTDATMQERDRLRRSAEDAGICISGIHWVLAHTEGFHVTHPDLEVRRRTSDYLCFAVDYCADLGGQFLIFGSPRRRDLLPGVSREDGNAWAIETFQSAVEQATKREVTICLEPLGPTESNFLNTAAEAMELADRLPSAHFQIMLDVKAMTTEQRPIPEVIESARGRFKYFHANDPNLKGPGFGAVDFNPIAQALRDVGDTGYISVEVFNFDEGAERIALESRAYLRRTFGL